MTNKKVKKLIQVGKYIAEVNVTMIYTDDDWSPYLSVEDALLLDEVRESLRRKDFLNAQKKSQVYTLTPLAI
ncbi:MAG: hypothetical protein B5M51_08725 [Anaerolinea sp. 4484_236]|nr:MAG: hypothetical protein B5M51_08725 [Anaerolinea sp. 4484_236]